MPKRKDIKRILVIGSGPIVIGQACEFDYSGTQACKALREEGFIVILVNSNPATIMTDPEFSDRTYIEPLHAEAIAKIIEKERPDALLPTLGGQTSLNLAVELAKSGVLEEYGVELIGAKLETIQLAEDRELFRNAMREIGLEVPDGGIVRTVEDAIAVSEQIGFPLIIRPSYTLGGIGGSVVYNREEFPAAARWGLSASPVHEVLIEQSVLGWKEYELEVMRDHADNFVIVCSIENFDPMGIHTGDSITVAPAQTLTDVEYQNMRDAAKKIVAAHRGRDRRGEHPVRPQPRDGRDGGDRDEPARVAQLGAGLQGHGLSHRQDRGQARRRLPAGRDPQRHHPQDPGLLRADHRLRRGQGAALGFREVPGQRPPARPRR